MPRSRVTLALGLLIALVVIAWILVEVV